MGAFCAFFTAMSTPPSSYYPLNCSAIDIRHFFHFSNGAGIRFPSDEAHLRPTDVVDSLVWWLRVGVGDTQTLAGVWTMSLTNVRHLIYCT